MSSSPPQNWKFHMYAHFVPLLYFHALIPHKTISDLYIYICTVNIYHSYERNNKKNMG